jgi:hypothetical protein
MGRKSQRLIATFVAAVQFATICGPALAGVDDLLLGREFSQRLNEVVADPYVRNSKDLKDFVSALRQMEEQSRSRLGGDAEQRAKAPMLTDEDQRKDLARFREQLDISQSKLNAFSERVARGEYEGFIDPEFWSRCERELESREGVAIRETAKAPPLQRRPVGESAPEDLKKPAFGALEACRGQAARYSADLAKRVDTLRAQIRNLDVAISEDEQRLKNKDLQAEERERIQKKLDKERADRDTAQAEQSKASGAKAGLDVWQLASGLVMIIAGLLLVFSFDVVDGWALVAGGISMISDALKGSGGSKPADALKPGNNGNQERVTDKAPTKTDGARKVDEAVSVKGPTDAQALDTTYKPQGFETVPPQAPGGNLVLLYNAKTKILVVARADKSTELLRIDLSTVKTEGAFWPKDIRPSDMESASAWAIDTKHNYVAVTVTGSFPGGKKTPLSILERPAGAGYVAIMRATAQN